MVWRLCEVKSNWSEHVEEQQDVPATSDIQSRDWGHQSRDNWYTSVYIGLVPRGFDDHLAGIRANDRGKTRRNVTVNKVWTVLLYQQVFYRSSAPREGTRENENWINLSPTVSSPYTSKSVSLPTRLSSLLTASANHLEICTDVIVGELKVLVKIFKELKYVKICPQISTVILLFSESRFRSRNESGIIPGSNNITTSALITIWYPWRHYWE